MSIGRIMTLAEKLSAEDQALVAGFILAMSSRGNTQATSVAPTEAAKPVSKTTAWRMKKAAEAGSTSVPNAFQNVPSGTAETFHGTENGTGGTFHGTQRADVRALSSASSSEKTAEKKSTGAGEREGGTESGTIGGTQRGTRDGTAGGTLIAKAESVRVALVEGFKRHGVIVPAKWLSIPHSTPVIDIARSVEESDLPKLIEGFFANEDTRKKGYPIAWLATNPAAYMTAPKAAVDVDTLALPPTLTEAERRAVSAERAIKRAPVPELCLVKPPPPDVLASAHKKMIEGRAS